MDRQTDRDDKKKGDRKANTSNQLKYAKNILTHL